MPIAETTTAPEILSWKLRLRRELVEHRTAYIVLVLSIIVGSYIFPIIFPGATPLKGALGGFLLGIWAALSAVANKFIDE